MPLELGFWNIDDAPRRIDASAMRFEETLEDLLVADISIASPAWMVIGRQVQTAFGKFIDLLAIDQFGQLIVLELKRDKTPKDVVAQALDYGSWVRTLRDDDITAIYADYVKKYHPDAEPSFEPTFKKRFGLATMPDQLNESHELVVVASEFDASTERIVRYLAEEYEVRVNAIFFRCFVDNDRQYLARAWLLDPIELEAEPQSDTPRGAWNGEYYANYSEDRYWEDARKYGFISAGGGSWYGPPLQNAQPGNRVWVNMPGRGYVGVGMIRASGVMGKDFRVREGGKEIPIAQVPLNRPDTKGILSTDPEFAEYFVAIEWIKAVPIEEAFRERGLYGIQHSIARPKTQKWERTVERLRAHFGVK